MKLAIVLSAPPLRQVFRGEDPRAVSIVTERALWPFLDADVAVTVTVQCGSARLQAQLNSYFADLIRTEREFRSLEAKAPDARDGKVGNAKA